jgi:hypothetical protein
LAGGVKNKKTLEIIDELDKINIDALNRFIIAYTLYSSNPCNSEFYSKFQTGVNDIQKSLDLL